METIERRVAGKVERRKKRKRRLDALADPISPFINNYNPLTGQLYVKEPNEDYMKLAIKRQFSVSRIINDTLYPSGVRSEPILNQLGQQEIKSNPYYLTEKTIKLPGGTRLDLISVGELFNDVGVKLDADDPYTYMLAKNTKNYFDTNPENELEKQLKSKETKLNLEKWKFIK